MRAKDHPDDDAVIISRNLHLIDRRRSFDLHQHDVVKIFTEKGRDQFSRIEVGLGEKGELIDVFARVVLPDGSIITLQPEDVIEEDGETLVGDEKHLNRSTIVRLPGAKVGSVVEYGFTVRYPFAIGSRVGRMAHSRAPIAKYTLIFDVFKRFKFQLRTYNTKSPAKITRNGGYNRILLSGEGIPKSKDEEFSPDWTMRDPWWRFATYSGNKPTWDDAVFSLGKRLYDDSKDIFSGFRTELASSKPDCVNRDCLVSTALRYVNQSTDYAGTGSIWDEVGLKEVVAGKKATASQKALLLYKALSDLGVPAKFAATTRLYTKPIDRGFPASWWFNHLLVVVKNGRGENVFLDPSCEHCSVGELPDYSRGVGALILEPANPRNTEFKATWETANGRPSRGWRVEHLQDVLLKMNGDIEVHQTRIWIAEAAAVQRNRARARNKKAWTEIARRRVQARAKNGMVTTVGNASFNKQLGNHHFDFDYKVPRYASNDEGRLIFPLSIFYTGFYNDLEPERIGDIFQSDRTHLSNIMRLTIPRGFEVHSLPTLRTKTSAAFTSQFSIAVDGNTLTITRKLTAPIGRFPREDFSKLVAPIRAFHAFSKEIIILRRTSDKKDGK